MITSSVLGPSIACFAFFFLQFQLVCVAIEILRFSQQSGTAAPLDLHRFYRTCMATAGGSAFWGLHVQWVVKAIPYPKPLPSMGTPCARS